MKIVSKMIVRLVYVIVFVLNQGGGCCHSVSEP